MSAAGAEPAQFSSGCPFPILFHKGAPMRPTNRRRFCAIQHLEARRMLALVAAFGFDEASGATAIDASGVGNTGSINGATRTGSGKYGSALAFNGSSNWVTINDSASLHLTTGMTLEAWVRPNALNGFTTAVLKQRGT